MNHLNVDITIAAKTDALTLNLKDSNINKDKNSDKNVKVANKENEANVIYAFEAFANKSKNSKDNEQNKDYSKENIINSPKNNQRRVLSDKNI